MGHSISMLVNAVAEVVRAIPIKADISVVMNLLKKSLKVVSMTGIWYELLLHEIPLLLDHIISSCSISIRWKD